MDRMSKMLRLLGKSLRCSFCGRSEHEVAKLVAGRRAFICDTCIGLCVAVAANGPPFAEGRKIERRPLRVGERLRDWLGGLRRATLHLVEVGR